MVCGIFWRRAHRQLPAGMLAGWGLTVFYMLANAPAVRAWLGWAPEACGGLASSRFPRPSLGPAGLAVIVPFASCRVRSRPRMTLSIP